MSWHTKYTDKLLIDAYHRNGDNVIKAVAEMGCSINCMRHALRRAGLNRPGASVQRVDDETFAVALRANNGDVEHTASDLGYCTHYVAQRARALGIARMSWTPAARKRLLKAFQQEPRPSYAAVARQFGTNRDVIKTACKRFGYTAKALAERKAAV